MKRAADEGTEDDNVKRTNFEENGEEPRVEEAAKTEDGGGEGSKDESKPASGGGGGHKGVDQRFKIFVGGIDVRVTTEELQTHFETFGKVVDCVVMQDRATGRSRGFGFATMETQEMFDAALDNKSHELYGKVIVGDIDLQPWQHHNSTKLKPHQTNYANDEHPLSFFSPSLPLSGWNSSAQSLKVQVARPLALAAVAAEVVLVVPLQDSNSSNTTSNSTR